EEFRPTQADFDRLADMVEKAKGKQARAAVEEARQRVEAAGGTSRRRKFHTGNRQQEEGNRHPYLRGPDYGIRPRRGTKPEWAVVCEREAWHNFYGIPAKFLLRPETEAGKPPAEYEVVATEPADVWRLFEKYHPLVRNRFVRRVALTKEELGDLNRELTAV